MAKRGVEPKAEPVHEPVMVAVFREWVKQLYYKIEKDEPITEQRDPHVPYAHLMVVNIPALQLPIVLMFVQDKIGNADWKHPMHRVDLLMNINLDPSGNEAIRKVEQAKFAVWQKNLTEKCFIYGIGAGLQFTPDRNMVFHVGMNMFFGAPPYSPQIFADLIQKCLFARCTFAGSIVEIVPMPGMPATSSVANGGGAGPSGMYG